MISAIFATDLHGGFGYHGGLPWQHITEDLQHFKDTTKDQIVVMGRGTWESKDMPKPLPNRINAVVTTSFIPDVHRINPHNYLIGLDLLHQEYPNKEIFIIGGKQLIMLSLPILQQLFITTIKGEYESDVRLDLNTIVADFDIASSRTSELCLYEKYTRKE